MSGHYYACTCGDEECPVCHQITELQSQLFEAKKSVQPTQAQRTIKVNDVPYLKPTDAYECDLCSARIAPGDNAVCRSMYRNSEPAPDWEHEYLNPPINWRP